MHSKMKRPRWMPQVTLVFLAALVILATLCQLGCDDAHAAGPLPDLPAYSGDGRLLAVASATDGHVRLFAAEGADVAPQVNFAD